MCTQKPPYDYSEHLYQRYKDAFTNYINDMVGSRTGQARIGQDSTVQYIQRAGPNECQPSRSILPCTVRHWAEALGGAAVSLHGVVVWQGGKAAPREKRLRSSRLHFLAGGQLDRSAVALKIMPDSVCQPPPPFPLHLPSSS